MKKMFLALILFILTISLVGCSKERKLYVLNVGDYIEEELVEAFEEEYNCKVVYTELGSNEEIYQKLKNESYDICVVSDYMIDRMYQEGLIQELDFEMLGNYDFDILFPEAQDLINNQMGNYKNYFIPYFWGTVGILYNTEKEGIKEYIESKGLKAIFENNEYNKGMYNSSRDCLCMALIALDNLDINTPNEEEIREAMELVRSVTYRAWGDDNLKEMVHSGMLDMALVYSGDYLDEYYQCELDEDGYYDEDENFIVNFDYYAPEVTNIWLDGMVVTTTCKNNDLAYAFLDFFSDTDNAAENADYIGYCPLNKLAYDQLFLSEEEDGYGYDLDYDFFVPYGENRIAYRYVSDEHFNLLNDLLEESKSK